MGLGKLSRLRRVIVAKPQFLSMNFRIEWFPPREEFCIAAGRIAFCCVISVAVQLLPHLIEAMDLAAACEL